jgi:hypothetical protein
MKSVKQTAKEITEQVQAEVLAKLADPHAVMRMIRVGQIVLPNHLAEADKRQDELYALIGKAEDEASALRCENLKLKAELDIVARQRDAWAFKRVEEDGE